MQISELARASGVPLATVKFYLREGLLPEGRRTSATRADYGDEHLRRLHVVRALLGPAGLTVGRARELLRHVDAPPAQVHDLLGVAHAAVTPPVPDGVDTTPAVRLLRRWGWPLEQCTPEALGVLAAALASLDAAGLVLPEDALDAYGRAARDIGRVDVAGVPAGSVDDAVRYVVLGTVLAEPLLLALRRIAQSVASAERFGDAPTGAAPTPTSTG